MLRVAPYPIAGVQRRRVRREQDELEARVTVKSPGDVSVRGEPVPREGHRSSQRALHRAHETLDGVGVDVAAEQVGVEAMAKRDLRERDGADRGDQVVAGSSWR